MRLVCPNCEAKYEVPDDAIPDTGRDVQCASCGHGWFQMRSRPLGKEVPVAEPAPVAPAPAETDATETDVAETDVAGLAAEPSDAAAVAARSPAPEPQDDAPTEVPADPVAEPATAQAAEAVADPETEAPPSGSADKLPEIAAEAPAAAEPEADADRNADAEAARAPYAVDESVLAILREEAEREAAARRAEARLPEPQPDPGFAFVAAAAAPLAAEDKPSARRDLLPDVEEINSTLRPSDVSPADDALQDMPPPKERGGGFRSGFLIVMTIAMIGAAVYMSAPALSRMVPALAGPLDAYVGMINGLRLQLDGLMRSATVALSGT